LRSFIILSTRLEDSPRLRKLMGGAVIADLDQGSGFRVWGLRSMVKGLGFRVWGPGFRVWG
jgi:hypothetical protein